MTGAEFSQWRSKLGLSLTEAATLLGVGRRTIMGYLKKDELPAIVAIACRALARDKHLLAAHYVPAKKASAPRRLTLLPSSAYRSPGFAQGASAGCEEAVCSAEGKKYNRGQGATPYYHISGHTPAKSRARRLIVHSPPRLYPSR